MIVAFMPKALPIGDIGALEGLLGGMLVLQATTVLIFQVGYTFNLVVPEDAFNKVTVSDGLATKSSFMIFWTLRGFGVCLVSCPAYLIYHFGVGYDDATAAPALIAFMFLHNRHVINHAINYFEH